MLKSWVNVVALPMNRVQRLKDEITRLKKEEIAAQASGALNGMTVEESRRYKKRHLQIKTLAIEIAALGRQARCTIKGGPS
jgi:hypothetical protein